MSQVELTDNFIIMLILFLIYRRGLFTNLQTHYRSYYQIKYFTYETNYWKQKNYLDEKATLEYILNNYVEEDENGRGSVK